MSQPKGQVPPHIQQKKFNHSSTDHIILILDEVEDPRKPSCNFHHSLVTILFISLMGVLCGAKDWEEIVQAAHGMIDWISKYVDTSSGIPSSQTLKRVMSLIPTNSLSRLLESLKSSFMDFTGDVVAIDGKTLRGSRGWSKEDKPLHLLHAWSTEYGICLGQISVDEKSNEITAFPQLIESLELKGTIVTTDALNTQNKVADAIIAKKADYVLPVKENHKGLYEDIKLLFEDADKNDFKGVDAAKQESLEKSAGRVEERYYDLIDIQDLESTKEWTGCLSVGRVIRRRTKKEKISCEVCFYITSLDLDIEKFAKSVRKHWGVENGLHMPLDVVFEEDRHRYQDKIGAANLSLLRKVALATLAKDTLLKCGKPAKQMRAATSSDYRDHLLKIAFNDYSPASLVKYQKERLYYSGDFSFDELRFLLQKNGYSDSQVIAEKLVELYSKQNQRFEQDIQQLNEKKVANNEANKLLSMVGMVPQMESTDKVLKYERSLQKSIYQNLIMLKKLQGVF